MKILNHDILFLAAHLFMLKHCCKFGIDHDLRGEENRAVLEASIRLISVGSYIWQLWENGRGSLRHLL
jgi:hypothetical protein